MDAQSATKPEVWLGTLLLRHQPAIPLHQIRDALGFGGEAFAAISGLNRTVEVVMGFCKFRGHSQQVIQIGKAAFGI